MTDALQLRGVVRRFGERVALDALTLRLEVGQTLVVFGRNGSGKTTLLRVLATLLRPHEGDIRVLGARLPDESWSVRARIGFLAHEPLLYRELTVRENLIFHARLRGVPFSRVDELLERTRLSDRIDEPLRLLSRGMIQRAAICRAVLHDPELLLLDEPRANLDPGGGELVDDLTAGRTRVLSSHDPERGLADADVALGLQDGRAMFLAPAGEIDPADVAALYR